MREPLPIGTADAVNVSEQDELPRAEAIVVDSADPDALGRALGDPGFGTRLRAADRPSTPPALSGVGPTPGA